MGRSAEFTVLVTGGGGRLGRLVVAALRERGTRALALSRHVGREHSDNLAADLADRDAAMSALNGRSIDAIIHLAAAMHHDDASEINARMDATLEAIIRATEPRSVVFTSTGAVYGDQSALALVEDSPTLGSSDYALSKLATEQRLRAATKDFPGLSSTTLRVFNIAGPAFPDSLVQRLLAAEERRPARLVNPKLFVRDYIHQSDVVRVILAAVARGEVGHRVVNVGAGIPVSTLMMLKSLHIGNEEWIEVPGRASSNWSGNGLMRELFGVAPLAIPTLSWASAVPGRRS